MKEKNYCKGCCKELPGLFVFCCVFCKTNYRNYRDKCKGNFVEIVICNSCNF